MRKSNWPTRSSLRKYIRLVTSFKSSVVLLGVSKRTSMISVEDYWHWLDSLERSLSRGCYSPSSSYLRYTLLNFFLRFSRATASSDCYLLLLLSSSSLSVTSCSLLNRCCLISYLFRLLVYTLLLEVVRFIRVVFRYERFTNSFYSNGSSLNS